MKTTVERLDAHTVRLNVTVPASDVDAAIDAAYKRIAGKVKIAGFRAGKAPRPVIDTQIGREAVIADAQDELLGTAYGQALDAERLRPIAQPDVDDFDLMEAGKEFSFTAQVEVRPELTISSADGLSIEVPPSVTADAEIDAQIEHTRERFASVEPVEDRGIEADDFVLISFVGTVDGEEYEGNVVDRYLYEMNRGLMPPEFDAGLLGLKAEDTTTVAFEIPDTSSNKEFVGKTASFDVTVHEVKAKVLPEIDDEFASNVGGYETVAEMRDSLRETMDKAKQVGHKRAVERAAREALAERLEGDVPETMIVNTQGQMMRDFINGLESRGASFPEYLQATGVTMDKIEADVAEQARKVVAEELALEALFRHQGWEVTEVDLDEAIAEMAGESDKSAEELRASWEESGVIAVLAEQIMHRRAVEWLMDPANVTVTEVEPEADEASDKE
ncbi:MAG: trigger factor [Actinomycetota bacterium]|nr:trigger factor [Actinomycetota bacterium]